MKRILLAIQIAMILTLGSGATSCKSTQKTAIHPSQSEHCEDYGIRRNKKTFDRNKYSLRQ